MLLRAMTLGLLALPTSAALGEGQAVGLKVGALGLGAEYTYELTERIALRGGLYGSQLGLDADEGGIDYEVDSSGIHCRPVLISTR